MLDVSFQQFTCSITINVTYIKKALAGSGAGEDAMHQQIGGRLIIIYSDAVWF